MLVLDHKAEYLIIIISHNKVFIHLKLYFCYAISYGALFKHFFSEIKQTQYLLRISSYQVGRSISTVSLSLRCEK